MLAKEIGMAIWGEWKEGKSGQIYPNPQVRITVTVETNNSLDSLNYEETDPVLSDQECAKDLLDIIGEQLSPSNEMALVEKLVDNLTEWATYGNKNRETVLAFMEGLTAKCKEQLSQEEEWTSFSPTIPGNYLWRREEGQTEHHVQVTFPLYDGIPDRTYLCYTMTDFIEMLSNGQWKKATVVYADINKPAVNFKNAKKKLTEDKK